MVHAFPWHGRPQMATWAFAGDDLRVLLAQFTTAGIINGQFQVQVFVEGNQGNEFRDLLPICSGDG